MKLPTLDPVEVVIKENLLDIVKQEIHAANGVISFARYMEIALYAENLGYYARFSHKWGSTGDYVTAPHLSSLFAEALSNSFAEVLREIPEGDILEIGAGSGLFAVQMMMGLQKQGILPRRYFIYEKSHALRNMQQQFIETQCPQFLDRFQWLSTLDGLTLEGIIFGNEVLDALPCHLFRVENGYVKEKCVTIHNQELQWIFCDPISEGFAARMHLLQQEYFLSDGYESEIHLHLADFMKSVENTLKKGVVLFFDYGYGRSEYYHPDRITGTLMCFYKHHRHPDPLLNPGLQDITAHVDFTTVIESTGLDLLGFTTQAGFLLGSGLTEIMAARDISIRDSAAIKTLIMPQEMGEIIKVMGLGKGFDKVISGFGFQDLRNKLG